MLEYKILNCHFQVSTVNRFQAWTISLTIITNKSPCNDEKHFPRFSLKIASTDQNGCLQQLLLLVYRIQFWCFVAQQKKIL